ncbi:OB-fold nucleic acid binding domain-containing protein [Nocardioides solisilvae]|uniref:OB-fold nucleic acid binding domain-containing protein n=1 Tax=Nocardioides solisilvae TaxID=1542435 RepID=UPI001EF5B08E|nr:OB-fold nucleic acid binding domain-containing protein [Nocardioides solisilvae]
MGDEQGGGNGAMGVRRRLRQSLSRWADSGDQQARDLRQVHGGDGVQTIRDAPEREPVLLRGSLRTVTLRPRGGVPALEADLEDGTDVVTLVWLGRRRIIGIEPGRSLSAAGRIGVHEGRRIMYNPRYELVP